jgi:hypothetical protein
LEGRIKGQVCALGSGDLADFLVDDILLVGGRHLRTHLAGNGSDLLVEAIDFLEEALLLSIELPHRVPNQLLRLDLQTAQVFLHSWQSGRLVVRISFLFALDLRQPDQLVREAGGLSSVF